MRWEYRTVAITSDVCDIEQLDRLGADGWELVTITSSPVLTTYIFKRQKGK